MLSKINIWSIIKSHFLTLKSVRTNKLLLSDYLLFLGVPLLGAIILVTYDIYLDKDKVDIFIQSLSILAGFSFNLLAIIFGFMDRLKIMAEQSTDPAKKVIVKEIHSNISFNILNAVFTICILFVLSFYVEKQSNDICLECMIRAFKISICINSILHIIVYFLLGLYLLTLLMILKRVNILFKNEF